MARMGDGGTLPVLKSHVDLMSQNELRTFIAHIIRTVTGVKPQYGNPAMKPEWWPCDVPFSSPREDPRDQSTRQEPWADVLRTIVRNCYQYYGQEHLLRGDECDPTANIKVVNNQDGSVSFITQRTVVTLEDIQNTPYASCPTVEAATPGRSLSASTGTRPILPTGLFKSTTSPITRAARDFSYPEEKPFVEVFMCFYCEKEFRQKGDLQRHQKECPQRPSELQGSRMSLRARTRKQSDVPKFVPRKPRNLIEEKVVFPGKCTYVEALGLLQHAKAECVRRQSIGRKINCDVIEVEENKHPKTPTTPRTPKSLISQLSRDASPPARVRLKIGDDLKEDDKEELDNSKDVSDNESECSKSDSGEDNYRPRRAATLLNIDLSSLLGERVIKHISSYFANLEMNFGSDSSRTNYENFCRTPTKIKFTERLRSRGKDGFQVTFRKTKRSPKHCHSYKFRRSELREFSRVVETGLNKRSRALKRKVKECKVVVDRLSKKDIRKWCKRSRFLSVSLSPLNQDALDKYMNVANSPVRHEQSVYPPSPAMRNRELLKVLIGPQSISSGNSAKQQLPHIYSEDPSAEVMQQKWKMFQSFLPGPGVTGSPADLTPPSTPEEPSRTDDDVICIDDMDELMTSGNHQSVTNSRTSNGYSDGCYAHLQQDLTDAKSLNAENSSVLHSLLTEDSTRDMLEDDVISISSTESSSDNKNVSSKRPGGCSPTESDLPAKRRKIDNLCPAALLFKCHLCFEQITCHDNANVYIKGHFARKHDVYNIDLIEHQDASGNKVVSIVEVPTPERPSPPSPAVTKQSSPPSVVPANFYHKEKENQRKPEVASRGKADTRKTSSRPKVVIKSTRKVNSKPKTPEENKQLVKPTSVSYKTFPVRASRKLFSESKPPPLISNSRKGRANAESEAGSMKMTTRGLSMKNTRSAKYKTLTST